MVIKYPMLHDKEWLKHQLEEEGKSYRQIAKELGCTLFTVIHAASKFGLKSGHPSGGECNFKHGLGGMRLSSTRDISYYEKNARCYLKKARIMLEAGEVVDPHCGKGDGEE